MIISRSDILWLIMEMGSQEKSNPKHLNGFIVEKPTSIQVLREMA